MRCWPLSVIRTSPLLPASCMAELDEVCKTKQMTVLTLQTCGSVAMKTQPVEMDGLVIIESEDATQLRFAYMKLPSAEQWARVERAMVIEAPDRLIFMIEAVH